MMFNSHVQLNQPLLAHHWHPGNQCLLTTCFMAPSIPWGVSAPGGKMRKQLLKDHNFLNNSPIFIIESSTLIYLLFKMHCKQYISIWEIVLDLVKVTWHNNFMARCKSLQWANTCSLWSGIKSWPWAWCLQWLARRRWHCQLRLCHTCITDVMHYLLNMLIYWVPCVMLTHCGLVTPYGGRDLGQYWLR